MIRYHKESKPINILICSCDYIPGKTLYIGIKFSHRSCSKITL